MSGRLRGAEGQREWPRTFHGLLEVVLRIAWWKTARVVPHLTAAQRLYAMGRIMAASRRVAALRSLLWTRWMP